VTLAWGSLGPGRHRGAQSRTGVPPRSSATLATSKGGARRAPPRAPPGARGAGQGLETKSEEPDSYSPVAGSRGAATMGTCATGWGGVARGGDTSALAAPREARGALGGAPSGHCEEAIRDPGLRTPMSLAAGRGAGSQTAGAAGNGTTRRFAGSRGCPAPDVPPGGPKGRSRRDPEASRINAEPLIRPPAGNSLVLVFPPPGWLWP
jgi:hypothetical protein